MSSSDVRERFTFVPGSVAVVTGGSRGIGAACAVALAQAGCDVAVNCRSNTEQAEKTAEIVRSYGRRAMVVPADVSDESAVVAMFRTIAAELGKVSVAVLNSGITSDGYVAAMSYQKWNDVLSTNLGGAFLTGREAAKHMYRTGGSIVLVGSTSGIAGRAGQANYSASKGGIVALAKTMADELAHKSVRVNVVAPGFVETDMLGSMAPKHLDAARAQVPLGRIGVPEDVAAAVVFLSSRAAAYVTGKVLAVDGGMITS